MATNLRKNNVIFSVRPGAVFEDVDPSMIASDATWNQGDQMVWDSVNARITTVSDEASAVTFLGVARQSVVNGKEVQPYTTDSSANQARVNLAGPQFGSVYQFNLKSGDTFTAGAPVYAYPVGGKNYIQASGTKSIGVFQGPTITAASSDTGLALIGHRYPGDILDF